MISRFQKRQRWVCLSAGHEMRQPYYLEGSNVGPATLQLDSGNKREPWERPDEQGPTAPISAAERRDQNRSETLVVRSKSSSALPKRWGILCQVDRVESGGFLPRR